MRSRFVSFAFGLLVALSAGCDAPKFAANPASAPAPATNAPALRPLHLDHAQPKLALIKLWVGPKEMNAEMCLTATQVATGLMFRPGIGEDEGMLFVFPEPRPVAFYMKNVNFEIDAAYLDAEGIIQEIVHLKKMDETPVPSKSENIQFVLETAPGWFERNGIAAGTLVKSAKRSLRAEFGFN